MTWPHDVAPPAARLVVLSSREQRATSVCRRCRGIISKRRKTRTLDSDTHPTMSATTFASPTAALRRASARAPARIRAAASAARGGVPASRRAPRAVVVAISSKSRGASTPRRRQRGSSALARASADETTTETTESPAAAAAPAPSAPPPGTFAKICDFDDLPRGDRKQFNALGKSLLMFYYKDTICCIESRSPAEGAFSEGFANARLTQDGCIICPSTQSTFDLKTGEIRAWYPDNPVLRKLTPIETCRPMEVFPVLARQDGIYVDVKNGSLGPDFRAATTMGGSNTSLENNNVYAVEPMMYVEGEDGDLVSAAGDFRADAKGASKEKMDPGTLAITIAGVAALALGGSATCVFYEQYVALGVFWLIGFGVAAKVGLEATGALDDDA